MASKGEEVSPRGESVTDPLWRVRLAVVMRILLPAVFLSFAAVAAAQEVDPVAPWTRDVHIAPLCAIEGRHSIHSYYVANPESPDGRRVLFLTSTHPSGYVGEVRMMDRTTGEETVLAQDVHTEDAHRVACQQWLAGGRLAAFHEVIGKKWRVVVDVETLKKTVVAEDRQAGFGRPEGDLLPMYGCHWNPGPYRDLYVWDAKTGQTRAALKIEAVEEQHGEWLAKEFAGKATSIFFPVLSPDLNRVDAPLRRGTEMMVKRASGGPRPQS